MDITTRTIGEITVVEIVGELDSRTSPQAQEKILPAVRSGGKLVLDMSQVPFMSSAGLRMLLQLHRQTSATGGRISLVGLSEELVDTMSATGFLGSFTTYDTVEAAVAALEAH